MAVVIETPSLPVERRPRGRLWTGLPPKAKIGAVILGVFALVAVVGPAVAPYDPSAQSSASSAVLQAPSGAHLLGTTSTGQDVFSQILVGTRATLEIGLGVGLIATLLAVIVGTAGGLLGGFWDEVLSFVTNVFLVLPALPLLAVLLAYQSARGQLATIGVLSALGWPFGARVIRAQTLSLRNRDFVAASRETGERTWRILFVEIVPNQLSLIAASFVGAVLYAVAASVALSFLGLTDTSKWSLGTVLYWAYSENALPLGAWWWFVPAGLAVALIGMGLVLVNFGLDELGNPRLRDAAHARELLGRVWRPADPTPVLRGQRPHRTLLRRRWGGRAT
jgi:peptide/nickel transport system permease protein